MIGQAALHEHEALVPSTYVVQNPAERRTILTRLAKQYGAPPRPCRAFPGGHPTSLTRPDIARVRDETCFFSLKTDGVRYLLLLCDLGDEYKAFCIDRCLRIFEIVVWCNEDYFTKTTLLDGELVFDHARNRLCYQVFDVVTMRGRSCRAMRYSDRLQVLHDHLLSEIPDGMDESSELFEQYIADEDKLYCAHRADVCMHMAPKRFVPLDGARRLWHERHQSPFPNDGLIVHFDDCPIASGTCRDQLKWKPNNAIDVLLDIEGHAVRGVRCREDGREVALRTLEVDGAAYEVDVEDNHLLQCLVHRKQHGACALVECLVSFSDDGRAKLWPMRERTDKVEANDVRVIRSTLRVIREAVGLDELLPPPPSDCVQGAPPVVARPDEAKPAATDPPVPEQAAPRRSKRRR